VGSANRAEHLTQPKQKTSTPARQVRSQPHRHHPTDQNRSRPGRETKYRPARTSNEYRPRSAPGRAGDAAAHTAGRHARRRCSAPPRTARTRIAARSHFVAAEGGWTLGAAWPGGSPAGFLVAAVRPVAVARREAARPTRRAPPPSPRVPACLVASSLLCRQFAP